MKTWGGWRPAGSRQSCREPRGRCGIESQGSWSAFQVTHRGLGMLALMLLLFCQLQTSHDCQRECENLPLTLEETSGEGGACLFG